VGRASRYNQTTPTYLEAEHRTAWFPGVPLSQNPHWIMNSALLYDFDYEIIAQRKMPFPDNASVGGQQRILLHTELMSPEIPPQDATP
jgi:hypothetical protein